MNSNIITQATKRVIGLVSTMMFISATAWAQFFGPPAAPPDVLDNPIDGGLSLLLGAGAVYGAKKLRDYRNKNNKNEEGEE
jgi:hypothetical protein